MSMLLHCLVASMLYTASAGTPVFDYLNVSAYTTLASIQPAGYFEVGLRYVHPPRVEWKPLEGAARYELLLIQDGKVLGSTPALQSPCFIAGGWEQKRTGKASVVIEGFNADGQRVALSRMFPFYIVPDFEPGTYTGPKQPYREAAFAAFNALYRFELPQGSQRPTEGQWASILPVLLGCAGSALGWSPYSFPVLHDWGHTEMLVALNAIADESLRELIQRYARSVGDHLILSRFEDEQWPYRWMVKGCVDYEGMPAHGYTERDPERQAKMKRLCEPAKCGFAGHALLQVHEVTGDAKYLDAALQMAETFVRTQLEDGSWPARVDARTGEVLGAYSSSVGMVASFLDDLNGLRPDTRFVAARDRAIQWLAAYPMKTYGWVVNFDDNPAPASTANPYIGLSNWDLFASVRYLAEHPDRLADMPAKLSEQMRWADNHFVFYGSDPLLPFEPFYPGCGEQGNPHSFISPYACWLPMDFHTANWGLACLAMYRLTGEGDWLAKARAAANTLTQYQLDDGRTMTWMCDKGIGLSSQWSGDAYNHTFWPGGWALSAALWAQLVKLDDKSSR